MELQSYIEREKQLLSELEKAKNERLDAESNMNSLVGELEFKDLTLEQLKSKEEELNECLQTVEQRYTTLNNSMLSSVQAQSLQKQDKNLDELTAKVNEANAINRNLEEQLNHTNKETERLKADNLSKTKLAESLNKQIEELEAQLLSYKNKTVKRYEQDKLEEPEVLELSFKSYETSRKNTNASIVNNRKTSEASRKRYELKTSHFVRYNDKENPKPGKPASKFDDVKSIITTSRKNSRPRNVDSYIMNYQGFGYLCFSERKKLSLIAYQNNTIYVIDHRGMEILHEIPILMIDQLTASSSNDFLYEIAFYNDSMKRQENIVLELPTGTMFLKAIKNSVYFDPQLLGSVSLTIESSRNFCNASLKLFSTAKRGCILETWVNSFFTNWNAEYYVIVENVLLKLAAPAVFHYKDYHKIIRKPYMYSLENYNIIKDKEKIGLARPYTFALKIHNENTDIVLACLMEEEKDAWVDILS